MRSLSILFAGLGFAIGCLADGPVFDVVSVKSVAVDESVHGSTMTGGPGTDDPVRFTAGYVTMPALLYRAFNLPHEQLVSPSWATQFPGNFYSLSATMPPATTQAQFQTMLQNMLIERFHMVVHHETRKFPGYDLVVDNSGARLQAVNPQSAPNQKSPGPRMTGMVTPAGTQQLKYQEWTMEKLAAGLGNLIAASVSATGINGPIARVTNKTDLNGTYTFALEFSSANRTMQAPAAGAGLDPGSEAPNIFNALRQQLGLRLVKVADLPLDVVVIDSLDKIPTPD